MFVVLTHRFLHHNQPVTDLKQRKEKLFNMNVFSVFLFHLTAGGNHINGQSATWPRGWSDGTAQVHRRCAGQDFRQEVQNLISTSLRSSRFTQFRVKDKEDQIVHLLPFSTSHFHCPVQLQTKGAYFWNYKSHLFS